MRIDFQTYHDKKKIDKTIASWTFHFAPTNDIKRAKTAIVQAQNVIVAALKKVDQNSNEVMTRIQHTNEFILSYGLSGKYTVSALVTSVYDAQRMDKFVRQMVDST